MSYGSTRGPPAIAHRGGAGLAAENTLDAFARSYALGLRYVETDARVTADGVCVAFHDADLRRLRRLVDLRTITVAHTLGLRVVVRTVNDPMRIHQLFDAGVDDIITDRPDLLRDVLIARDQWTAPSDSRAS